jgi:OmpA family
VVIRGITFETESADLSGASCAAVTNSAICPNRYPALKVAVVGHTDNTGQFEFNIDLSERRAQAIAQVLQTDIDVPTDRRARSASAPRPDRHRHDELRPQPEPPRRAGDDRLTPATSRRRQRDPEPAQRRAREGSRDPHGDLDRRSVLAGIDGKQPVVIAKLSPTATNLCLPPHSPHRASVRQAQSALAQDRGADQGPSLVKRWSPPRHVPACRMRQLPQPLRLWSNLPRKCSSLAHVDQC